MKINVLIAEGFEEIEAITLIDLLRRAEYDVKTVSITQNREVKGGHDIKIITDSIFDDVSFDGVDVLVIPGGVPGVTNLASHEKVLSLIKDSNRSNASLIRLSSSFESNNFLSANK